MIARHSRETSGRLAPAAHFAKFELCCIDRLARSIGDLQDIVRTVQARGAILKATEQPIDTSTAAGKCFLDMLGVFAEFETNLRRERRLEGIAKAAGVTPHCHESQLRYPASKLTSCMRRTAPHWPRPSIHRPRSAWASEADYS